MGEISFGEILRQTRERKGLDLNATARRLRIRPDILRAIEDSNFAAMPPRGYTRNMVNGYARYLGLNPTEITGMYIEELYAYQSGISRSHRRGSGIDMSAADEAGRSHRSSRHDQPSQRPRADRSREARRARGAVAADELSSMKSSRGVRGRTGRVYPDSKTHRSSGSLLPRLNDGASYTNPNDGWRSKLPFIIAAAVVLVIVVIVCSFIFSGTGKSNEAQVANMPVTGLDESSSTSSDTSDAAADSSSSSSANDVAPTEATFEYSVADGAKPYIEIYIDGTTEVAKDLTGPTSGSYTFTDKVKFVCAETDGVTVKVNGEEQELKTNSKGIVNNTYYFSDILNAWNEAHGIATSSSSSSDTSSSSSSASSSSSSKSSSSSSSSSKSSKSSSSSSSSSSSKTSSSSN